MPVPILMYHKVGLLVATKHDTFLNVSARDFARQMRILVRLGYRARTFGDVMEAQARGQTLPPRTLTVTFDDGYACLAAGAVPALAEVEWPGTVFVVSQAVGRANDWDKVDGLPVLPLLGWNALRDLQSAGWEIGGHTATHPHLDALDNARALADIAKGKRETEAQIGTPLRTFCYPYGHFNTDSPRLVRDAGFSAACTTRSGIAHPDADPFLLPRVKVAYRDGVLGLLYRLLVRPHLPDFRPQRRSQQTASAPPAFPS